MSVKTPIPEVLTGWAKRHGFDCSNINSRIDNAMSALMLAAMQGELEIIRVLLTAGADINLINDDENNVQVSKFDLVRELVRAGADIRKQTVDGFNAMDSATTLPILQFLKPVYASA